MASSRGFLDYVLEQLSDLPEISYRQMMEDAAYEIPYEGAKPMLVVDGIDNREFMTQLVETMYDELPAPKKKR